MSILTLCVFSRFSGTRESRLGSIINQLRENKEKNIGHKINKVLDTLSNGSPTDADGKDIYNRLLLYFVLSIENV